MRRSNVESFSRVGYLVGAILGALLLSACNPLEFFFGDSKEEPNPVPTTPASASVALTPAKGECPTTRGPVNEGTLAPSILEASGIATSKRNSSVYWVHNDSGDTARAFAVGSHGNLLLTVAFDTEKPTDIEDIAIEDGPDASFLYLGDIGDNAAERPDVVIHRFREPQIASGQPPTLSVTSEKMHVRYADGAHDAETLLFDPVAKELLIVTKVLFGKGALYRVGPFKAGTSVTATKVAGVPFAQITAGAISRNGKYVAIRNYTSKGFLWVRRPGEDLGITFAREPCEIPIPAAGLQGEDFAFLADDSGYVTTSEGKNAPLDVARFD